MIRTCIFGRFQKLQLPLVIVSAATIFLTSICSPLFLRLQPQPVNANSQSISQFEGLEEVATPHKTDDSSPKKCTLLITLDSETVWKDDLLPEYCRPVFASAIPLSMHLVYTQTVTEHL